MKAQRGKRGIAGWLTPRPGRFTPEKRPGTHCIGGWVDPTTGLDGCGNPRLHRDSIPGPSSPESVAIPTELLRPTRVVGKSQGQMQYITPYLF